MKNWKKAAVMGMSGRCSGCRCRRTGCQKKEAQVIIYSNADDEAVEAMKHALDGNGYGGKYLFQTFGTSELGGKLLAEGTNLEADLVTMSTFYLQSAQEQNTMFVPPDLPGEYPWRRSRTITRRPITSQEAPLLSIQRF